MLERFRNIVRIETESQDAALKRVEAETTDIPTQTPEQSEQYVKQFRPHPGLWTEVSRSFNGGLVVQRAEALKRRRELVLFDRRKLPLPSKVEHAAFFSLR